LKNTSLAVLFGSADLIGRLRREHKFPERPRCQRITLSGAKAAADAVASRRRDPIRVWSLQEIHARERSVAG